MLTSSRVAVYYYRSQHYDLGDAKCWVDDNETGAVRLAGYWTKEYNVATYVDFDASVNQDADSCRVAYIDEKVTPGDHL